MISKEILSVQHPLIKNVVSLRLEKSAREEQQQVLVVGKKLLTDLALTTRLTTFFYLDAPPLFQVSTLIHVSESVLKKITGLQEPDGWAALVALPPPQSLFSKSHILILDQISNPGNLGTLWRTAYGLGWEGIWLTPGCVDPFNDKALRAAKGATFHLPYDRILPEQILEWIEEKRASIFVADLKGDPLPIKSFSTPRALLLSNEAKGPNSWTESLPKITIPMVSSLESLNVASAGSILLYALRPQS